MIWFQLESINVPLGVDNTLSAECRENIYAAFKWFSIQTHELCSTAGVCKWFGEIVDEQTTTLPSSFSDVVMRKPMSLPLLYAISRDRLYRIRSIDCSGTGSLSNNNNGSCYFAVHYNIARFRVPRGKSVACFDRAAPKCNYWYCWRFLNGVHHRASPSSHLTEEKKNYINWVRSRISKLKLSTNTLSVILDDYYL